MGRWVGGWEVVRTAVVDLAEAEELQDLLDLWGGWVGGWVSYLLINRADVLDEWVAWRGEGISTRRDSLWDG